MAYVNFDSFLINLHRSGCSSGLFYRMFGVPESYWVEIVSISMGSAWLKPLGGFPSKVMLVPNNPQFRTEVFKVGRSIRGNVRFHVRYVD